MPAMSATEPSPSRMKSKMVSTGSFLGQCFRYVKCSGVGPRFQGRGNAATARVSPRGRGAAVSRCGSAARRRLGPAGRLDPLVLAGVCEELRAVVADAWRGRVVAALERRGAKGLRALERLDGREDRVRGQVGVADLVEDLVDGHH